MKKKIGIIGSGFSGLSAACYAAKAGYEVHVYEKNEQLGGRARQFTTEEGFVFDMGPSWYWMPDIIADFFNDFDVCVTDVLQLVKLDPQFEIVFEDGKLTMPSKYEAIQEVFESIEKGAGKALDRFMTAGKYKYEIGMKQFVVKPCHNWSEFMSPNMLMHALKLDLLRNFRSYVAQYFKHKHLKQVMEFPVIFLGSSPQKIPALYSLMNYGGYVLGTWYPIGGFYSLVEAMVNVAKSLGVQFHLGKPVEQIKVSGSKVEGLKIGNDNYYFDAVIGSSDYQHTEQLLPEKLRNYSNKYWEDRVFAPSCLIFYLGVKGTIANLKHHTLFFEHDLDEHMDSIYKQKQWPEKPLFYCCCPSKTDPTVAPLGYENLFLLIPVANDLKDDEATRSKYLADMLARISNHTGTPDLKESLVYVRSYCVSDFKEDYNAYGGNAYGLANTLKQTAVWKPKLKNKKLNNFWYTGQLTVPGPGVPPAIISGKIVSEEVRKTLN